MAEDGPSSVVVVSGSGTGAGRDGAAPPVLDVGRLPAGAPVVAADSGVDLAIALGLAVDVVVGDLDSVTPSGLAAVEADGATIERHPVDKDATDLALALACADRMLAAGGEVVVVGAAGGRLDHLLSGVLALTDPTWAHLRITAHLGPATLHVVHGGSAVEVLPSTPVGSLLTIVPVGGPAGGVTTRNLRWPLAGATLLPGTTWGVSNEVAGHPAGVSVESGTALVVLPGEENT